MTQINHPLTSVAPPVSLRQITGKIKESDELFQSIVSVFQEICDVNYSLLLVLEKEEIKKVYCRVESHLERQNLISLSIGIYQQNRAYIEHGEIFSLLGQNLLFPLKLKKKAQQLNIESVLLIPLQYQQLRVGVLCLYSEQNNLKWIEKNKALSRHLIAQSTLLIYQMQQSIEEKSYQKLIRSINQQINSDRLNAKVLKDILEQIANTFVIEQILLLEIPELPTLCSSAVNCNQNGNLSSKSKRMQQWQIYQSFSRSSQSESQQLNFEALELQNLCEAQQIYSLSQTERGAFFDDSFLSLPILVKGEFFGSLILQIKSDRWRFTTGEIQALEEISEQIGIAIYQIQIQEQLAVKQEVQKHTSEYFSNMTHELRAPLAGILGFARMLQEQIYGSLNSKQIQYVNAVITSGEHLMAIVNDLLDLSKIEANREELFLENLAVEDVCLAALSIVQGKAEQQGLALNLEVAHNVDFCFGDQQRLKQILINLLSNAIKFTELGSVTLKVERSAEQLIFSVIDTGIGITQVDQNKLFQPFQQIHSSLGRKHKGTGLGLALSQKLARLHGGDITLVSEVGKGSCFTITIPHQEANLL